MIVCTFDLRVAETLLKGNRPTDERKRGLPSNGTPNNKRKKGTIHPIPEIRFDNVSHFPVMEKKDFPSRCKMPNCKGKSRVVCEKCKVHLCLTSTKKCFKQYHSN